MHQADIGRRGPARLNTVARCLRATPSLSTRSGEYRGQIGCDNGTLEPPVECRQISPDDSLVQGGLHHAESLSQEAKERLGFTVGLALDPALSLALSLPSFHRGFTHSFEISWDIAFEHQ